jgi:hypothetical protein
MTASWMWYECSKYPSVIATATFYHLCLIVCFLSWLQLLLLVLPVGCCSEAALQQQFLLIKLSECNFASVPIPSGGCSLNLWGHLAPQVLLKLVEFYCSLYDLASQCLLAGPTEFDCWIRHCPYPLGYLWISDTRCVSLTNNILSPSLKGCKSRFSR